MTYYFGKSLGLAHPLHQHHHFLLLGWKGWKFLPNQAFNSLEKLHIIPMVIWTPDTFTCCSDLPLQTTVLHNLLNHVKMV